MSNVLTYVPLFHNGYFIFDPYGGPLGFKSLDTGCTYRLDIVAKGDRDAAAEEAPRNGRVYAEDVRIAHLVEAVVVERQEDVTDIEDIMLDTQPFELQDSPTAGYFETQIDEQIWEAYRRDVS